MADGELGVSKSNITDIFEYLAKNFADIQVIAVAGKNDTLKNKFEQICTSYNRTDDFKVFGFSDKVPELMYISDLVITKPGGLTSTESLVSDIPMIAISPIPRSGNRKRRISRKKWRCYMGKKR